ncbi:hypothetical protein DIPPA_09498 [Diplonema papillatum]|nr:hypothetical protein DIPPA_09498 [Diplonema papillatum]
MAGVGEKDAVDDGTGDASDAGGDEEIAAKLTRLSRLTTALAAAQLAMSAAVLYLSLKSREGNDQISIRDVLSAAIGLASGIVGVFAGVRRSETLARLYFIVQLWLLSTVTMFLYTSADKEDALHALCSPQKSYSASENSDECDVGVARNRAKISIAAAGMLLALATCVVSFDLEDALDDFSDQTKAEELVRAMADELDSDDMSDGTTSCLADADDGVGNRGFSKRKMGKKSPKKVIIPPVEKKLGLGGTTFGGFQDPGYITIDDEYVKKTEVPTRHTGINFLVSPAREDRTPDGYFDTEVRSIGDLGKLENEKKRQQPPEIKQILYLENEIKVETTAHRQPILREKAESPRGTQRSSTECLVPRRTTFKAFVS